MDVSDKGAGAGECEVELKLLAEPAELARLRRSSLISRFARGQAVSRPVLSVYYDTPDMDLAARGLALRVRKKGTQYVQTLKKEDAGAAATSRMEIEALLPDDQPDPALIADGSLRKFVSKRAAGSGLRPVYETDIRRTERQLITPDGDHVELAIDTGVIRADGREETVSELEFELKSGRAAALYELARPIADAFDVRLGVRSKAARGYALATGQSGIFPVKAAPPALDAPMTVDEACCEVLRACLAQIVLNEPSIITARDPEGVHQMRVGLRRFRSAALSFSRAALGDWLTPLAEEARWFASRLGRARDLDVFLGETLAPVEEAFPGHAGLGRLHAFAVERQKSGWVRARSAVGSRRFTIFVLTVSALLEERPWRRRHMAGGEGTSGADVLARPVRDFAREVLEGHRTRVSKAAREIDTLTTEERHALRIDLKKLRYNADSFAPVFSKKSAKPFLKALSDLQDVFGYLNDAAVAAKLSRKLAKQGGEEKKGSLREAVGLVTGWHAQLAAQNWKRARKRWRAFEKIRPFWRA